MSAGVAKGRSSLTRSRAAQLLRVGTRRCHLVAAREIMVARAVIADTLQSHPPSSLRVRRAGFAVLLIGLLGACLYYWAETRAAGSAAYDPDPRTHQQLQREIALQQGTMGVLLLEWSEALQRPATQAVIIAVVA